MNFDFTQNYFQLFGLQAVFELDLAALELQYRNLQNQFHPDNAVNQTDQQQRVVVQIASYVNTAYRTLISPLSRAEYLLQLLIEDETVAKEALPTEFLMEQMQLREKLENNQQRFEELQSLQSDIEDKTEALYNQFTSELGQKKYKEASAIIQKLQFYDKLLQECKDSLFAIEDAALQV